MGNIVLHCGFHLLEIFQKPGFLIGGKCENNLIGLAIQKIVNFFQCKTNIPEFRRIIGFGLIKYVFECLEFT